MVEDFSPQATCEGGDLDCGSGLLLMIKKSMDPLSPGEILEVKSRESTVKEDLPAWCRMVEHGFLGMRENETDRSYFVKKGMASKDSEVTEDKKAAKGYQWSVRVQGEEQREAKVFTRNHTYRVGQPAEFSEKVKAPSAVDYLLGSLASCITVGFCSISSRQGLTIDHIECKLSGGLDNVLYHMGIEDLGSPSFSTITGTLYVSSPDDEDDLDEVWKQTLDRSPVYQTLKRSVDIDLKCSVIL